jgi:cellulose biosynthesis protein BcsQ
MLRESRQSELQTEERDIRRSGLQRLASLVPVLADRHAVLIADTAGFGNRSTVICIGAADGVLVPASPGEGDIVEAQKMVAFVQGTAKTIRRDIQVRVVANRIRRGATLSRHLVAQIATRWSCHG